MFSGHHLWKCQLKKLHFIQPLGRGSKNKTCLFIHILFCSPGTSFSPLGESHWKGTYINIYIKRHFDYSTESDQLADLVKRALKRAQFGVLTEQKSKIFSKSVWLNSKTYYPSHELCVFKYWVDVFILFCWRKNWCTQFFCESRIKVKNNICEHNFFLNPDLR